MIGRVVLIAERAGADRRRTEEPERHRRSEVARIGRDPLDRRDDQEQAWEERGIRLPWLMDNARAGGDVGPFSRTDRES